MEATINDLADLMRESVENIQKQFDEPDDDFIPVMSLMPQEGENVMLALDTRWLANDETKKKLVKTIMVPAVSGVGAKLVATVFSAWHTVVPEGVPVEEIIKPSEMDESEREEAVLLTVMDSFNVETWMAPITRYDDKVPELGGWQKMATNSISGIFVEGIQEALRDSSGKTSPEFMELLSEQGIEFDSDESE